MTIYAVGINNDRTLQRFITQAQEMGENVTLVNLHAVCREPWRITIPASFGGSRVYGNEHGVVLDPNGSYFVRMIDLSPVLSEPESSAWRHMLVAISGFLETVPGRILNRPGAHAHNGAKPYHEWWLARQGFLVPPAITTSDPDAIRHFLRKHEKGIVKALCGMRGTAQAVMADDFDGFQQGQGPVHVQKHVHGYDLRVHVVGEEIHAEKIECNSVDYRERGADAVYTTVSIPNLIAQMLISAANEMGLAFTGWDFKVDAQGRYWCLEVNPMPGYDVYDRRVEGSISKSLVRYLRNDISNR